MNYRGFYVFEIGQLRLAKWLVILILSVTTIAHAGVAPLNLIPWPASVKPAGEGFAWNAKTAILADASFTNEAAWLADKLHLTNTTAAPSNTIRLTTQGAEGLGDEAYILEVTPRGAVIHAATAAGAFYGAQTLRQLMTAASRIIPGVTIEDAPRYAWRGMMLDVSRHFFDKAAVCQLLDWMADYKLNRLHLHLTDDQGWRLEIPHYPELTQTGARGNFSDKNAPPRFFSDEDIHELVAYAQVRHIVIVPEIDMPGHAAAATRTFPQLDGGTNTFNPARETTYDFLQNVLEQTMALFPSPWIHLGGDEVNPSGWKQDPEVRKKLQAEGLKAPQQLESRFVRRMSQFIQAQGRTPMGWDEITAGQPQRGTIIFWWRHDKPEVLAQALAGGYSVVLAPRAPCYFDYPQDPTYAAPGRKLYNTPEAVYRGPSIPTNIPPRQLKQILGVEGCIWTEHIATVSYLEFMAMPRLVALSEMAWTPSNQCDIGGFNARLKPFLAQYQSRGVHYYDPEHPARSLQEASQPASANARETAAR